MRIDNCPAFSGDLAIEIIEREVGKPIDEIFDEFNKKHGLTRHDAWLAETSEGPVVVALHEGPGADDFMQNVADSQDSFEVDFKEKLMEFHGMDLAGPPPGPMPVKMISS